MQNSDAKLDRLLRYYFSNQGTLRSVLLEAFNLDFAEMESEARDAVSETAEIMDDWGTKNRVPPIHTLQFTPDVFLSAQRCAHVRSCLGGRHSATHCGTGREF